jgi:DMSO/TMAO reductase YedYZ molybdopterin-dependent catalytic subunit
MPSGRLITRRRAIVAGLASIGGLVFARMPEDLPPTYGSLLRLGDNVTYAAHRALLPSRALVREYALSDITSFPATGTTDPAARGLPLSDAYARLRAAAFAGWTLPVEGRVARPRAFSLADLKRMASRTQVTRHTC